MTNKYEAWDQGREIEAAIWNLKTKRFLTTGERYDPAMKIRTVEQARAYVKALVTYYKNNVLNPPSDDDIESTEISNIKYYAGYYGDEVSIRISHIFSNMYIKDFLEVVSKNPPGDLTGWFTTQSKPKEVQPLPKPPKEIRQLEI